MLFHSVRYTLKTSKAPQQTIDGSQRPGSSKETVVLQLGVGSLIQCVETIIKSMHPGEEAIVYIDARAVVELRDMIADNLVMEVELKTILDGPPDAHQGNVVVPIGFDAVMAAAALKKTHGNACIQQNKPKQAYDLYIQGLQMLTTLESLAPSELEAKKTLEVTFHLNLAAATMNFAAYNLSIQHSHQALDILDSGTTIPDAISQRSKAYFRLGNAYEKAGQFRTAHWNYVRAANIKNEPILHQCAARVKPLADKEPNTPVSM